MTTNDSRSSASSASTHAPTWARRGIGQQLSEQFSSCALRHTVFTGIESRVEAKAALHKVAANSAIPSVNVVASKRWCRGRRDVSYGRQHPGVHRHADLRQDQRDTSGIGTSTSAVGLSRAKLSCGRRDARTRSAVAPGQRPTWQMPSSESADRGHYRDHASKIC